jgi:hypothetical protein
MVRNTAIGRKQCQLRLLLSFFVERLDHPTPGLALAVVDLSKVHHRTLHHLAAGAALVLYDAPIAMLLAVLEPSIGAQEHDGRAYYPAQATLERDLVSTTHDCRRTALETSCFLAAQALKIDHSHAQLRKLGKLGLSKRIT